MCTALRNALFCGVLFASTTVGAAADQSAAALDRAAIAGGAFRASTGVLSVNQASGNGNAQANVTAIGRAAKTLAPVRQTVANASSESGTAAIDAFAFSGSSGILQVNQSAGSGNAQANGIFIRIGDDALSNAVPQQSAATAHASQQPGSVSVAKTAFSGSKGILQISQVAGSGNRTASTFVLQIQNAAGH